jgi:hypothetical protein
MEPLIHATWNAEASVWIAQGDEVRGPRHRGRRHMTEPESHTLAYLRRIDEKLDRLGGEVGDLRSETGARLGRIEDELLVLNGIVLRLEGREVETTGLKALLDRTERRLAELERRMAGLEDAGAS